MICTCAEGGREPIREQLFRLATQNAQVRTDKTKVRQHDAMAFVEENVLRFDVPMNNLWESCSWKSDLERESKRNFVGVNPAKHVGNLKENSGHPRKSQNQRGRI